MHVCIAGASSIQIDLVEYLLQGDGLFYPPNTHTWAKTYQ